MGHLEELIAGQYIIRWTPVLSTRFDSTSFKKILPDLYKAYTKQVSVGGSPSAFD